MNEQDYHEIMAAENLTESELVCVCLNEAKRQQRFLDQLAALNWQQTRSYQLTEERKIAAIWEAIDWARHEKLLGYRILEDGESVVAEYLANLKAIKK